MASPGICGMMWIIFGFDKRDRCCRKKKVVVEEEEPEVDEEEKAMLFPNKPEGIPEKGFERLARDVALGKNKGGKLGVHIIEIGGKVIIDGFRQSAGGLKGVAEASGLVNKGDWIVGVGTMVKDPLKPDDPGTVDIMPIDIEPGKKPKEVGGEMFHEVLHMLKHVPNPVVLRMHAPIKIKQTGPDNELMAQVRRCSVEHINPADIIKELKGRDKKLMKKDRDELEDVLETAGEKDVMKHQVTASADVLQATVAVGNLKALKEEVTMHFRRINRIDKHKNSLLHICCREGFYEAVDFMLNKDNHPSRDKNVVDIETPNGSARTPLLLSFTPPHMTAAMRASKVVAKFQDQLAPADRMSVGGPTERAKLIVLLVENGAKVNVLDGQNWTPLMFACLWGWAKAVPALVKAGAKLHAINKDGDTPLLISCGLGHAGCVKALLKHEHPMEKIKDFWEEEPDHSGKGQTALTLSILRGDQFGMECVRALLAGDTNPELADSEGNAPIKIAAQNNHKDVCNLLLYHGVRSGKISIQRFMVDPDMKAELLTKIEDGTYETERTMAAKQQSAANAQRIAEQAVWQRFYDPYNKGAPYYYNKTTGESQWHEPVDWVEPVAVKPGGRRRSLAFDNSVWLQSTDGQAKARDVGEMELPGQIREASNQRRRSVVEMESELEALVLQQKVRGRRGSAIEVGQRALWPQAVNSKDDANAHIGDANAASALNSDSGSEEDEQWC